MRTVISEGREGVKIGGLRINSLRFVDDTTLLCNSKDDLSNVLQRTKLASADKGLLLNAKKTKIMVVDKNRTDFSSIKLDGANLEEVKEFIYLGSLINTHGSSNQKIRRRLAMARNAVQRMTTIWKSKNIGTHLKLKLLQATAFAVASYGCESWAMTKGDEKRVDAFEMWAYRRLLRVSWRDRRTNGWVRNKIGVTRTLRQNIGLRKMQYFGHVVRQDGLEKAVPREEGQEGDPKHHG